MFFYAGILRVYPYHADLFCLENVLQAIKVHTQMGDWMTIVMNS